MLKQTPGLYLKKIQISKIHAINKRRIICKYHDCNCDCGMSKGKKGVRMSTSLEAGVWLTQGGVYKI